MTKYQGFNLEEDKSRYRKFMHSMQFKAVSKAIQEYETENDGLTPAEVWDEVDKLIEDLRTLEADDRDSYITQLFNQERRRLKVIERDGDIVEGRGREQLDRSLTCVFYCLSLRLERACRNSDENPHSDLIDAIVGYLARISDEDLLVCLHKKIKDEGDRLEKKAGHEIEEFDELGCADEAEDWSQQWGKVAEHYAQKLYRYVSSDMQDAYNNLWNELKTDNLVAACMKQSVPLKGDESKSLGIEYNAKAMFNLLGLIYSKGFFKEFRGVNSFAKAATAHYDENGKQVQSRSEYFTPEKINVRADLIGLSSDQIDYIKKLINRNLKKITQKHEVYSV